MGEQKPIDLRSMSPPLAMHDEPMHAAEQESHARAADTSSGVRTRKASPMPLPRAPQGKVIAQRLLHNSTARPVQRFDSADYFLSLHHQQQRKLTDGEAPSAPAAAAVLGAVPLVEGKPEPPPPITRPDVRLRSP